MRTLVILLFLMVFSNPGISQIDSVDIQFESELEFPAQFLQFKSSIASRIDSRNEAYLYSANLIFGLGIYDISDPSNIVEILEMEVSSFQDLSVSTIQQIDNYLYVGLGDFQTENAASGLAILDITFPETPILKDIWVSDDYVNGVSHLDVYDEIVYLSMMNDGLLILDATEANDVQFVSQIIPDLTFAGLESEHYQGRGLTKQGSILYYTFDRGGFRAIDVSDIYHPVEVGKYINPDLIDKATAAYNDVIIVDNYAYLSVDYCGLEVLDISTSPWTLVEWYDPVDCQGFNWFGAEVHTNELVTACNDSLLFVSGGNSEVIVFDITDPTELKRIGGFFELDNELAAYGLHVLGNRISVSYINNPFNIPYVGNWGGLKMLSFSKLNTTNTTDIEKDNAITFYPNPVSINLQIENIKELKSARIFSANGECVLSYTLAEINRGYFDFSQLESGVYYLQYTSTDSVGIEKIVKR